MSSLLIGISLTGLLGCDKKDSPSGVAEDAAAVSMPTSPPVAASAPPTTTDAEAPAVPMDSIMSKLAREAHERPKVVPTAEDVLTAMETAGEPLSRREPSMGSTYKANYCLGGYAADGAFTFSACEYNDAVSANAGRDFSKKLLSKVPNREVWAHKATTLAIIQLKPDDATTAQKKKLVAAFNAM